MHIFYFTFPVGHKYREHYLCIESLSYAKARIDFIRRFGKEALGFQYSEFDWTNWQGLTVAQRYNLTELRSAPIVIEKYRVGDDIQ